MLELVRRLVLVSGIASGLWLFFLADLSPLYSFRVLDEKDAETPRPKTSVATKRHSDSPLTSVEVSGAAWEEFFKKAVAVLTGHDNDPSWLRRVPKYQQPRHGGRSIFFWTWEPPVSELASRLSSADKNAVVLAGVPGVMLEVQTASVSAQSFQLGSGLSEYGPPPSLIYHWRHQASWCLGAGLLLFLLIPWRKPAPGKYRFSTLQCLLGDAVWVLLVMVFFGLSLAIVGGSVQSVTLHPVFPIVLWPFAGLGLLCLWFAAWNASFGLEMNANGLGIASLSGNLDIRYSSVTKACFFEHRYPRWFIRLFWFAALIGKGSSSLRAAGQAFLLQSSKASGLALHMNNGATVYLWLAGPVGTAAFPGADSVLAGIQNSGVPFSRHTEELVCLFPPLAAPADWNPAGKYLWVIVLAVLAGPSLAVAIFSIL